MGRLAYEPLNVGDVVQKPVRAAVDVWRLKLAYGIIGFLMGLAVGLYYAGMHPAVHQPVDQGCALVSTQVTCTPTTGLT